MYFCPKCAKEFEDPGSCPHCQERLQPKLDPEQFNSKLVIVHKSSFPPLALMIKELLEKNGIFCVLQGVEWAGAFGGLLPVAMEANILVPEAKAEQAKKLIELYCQGLEQRSQVRICPHCGEEISPFVLECPYCHQPVLED